MDNCIDTYLSDGRSKMQNSGHSGDSDVVFSVFLETSVQCV